MRLSSRRGFLKQAGAASALLLSAGGGVRAAEPGPKRPPNVVFILTDDQGYGDLGCTGNPVLQTPRIDSLRRDGAWIRRFYACPVCTPTRACLMTGRYNYRTRAIDTYLGRAMMDPAEVTLAELLRARGYRTGLFGKWHLGDNYPMRPVDKGFDESLCHKGGGICQPSEPDNKTYFDPVLSHNGKDVRAKGYCTDVFADAAVAFIEANADRPFFAYLATNAPHNPLDVADAYWKPFAEKGLDEKTARIYGMIANLDENVGKVLDTLDRLKLAEDTIVCFMTDNGPALQDGARYNAGLRDGKGSVYEGGIRVPFFARWTGRIAPGAEIAALGAHIDVLPTLLDACGFTPPDTPRLDGVSLWPHLAGTADGAPDRTLFLQWHRGDAPEPFRNAAVVTRRFKLVNGAELYDLEADPGETTDIAADHPDTVQRLRADYGAWFADVGATRGYDPPRIVLGAPQENPAVLTRQDWRNAKGWGDADNGGWEVRIAEGGDYRVTVEFPQADKDRAVRLTVAGAGAEGTLPAGETRLTLPGLVLPAADGRLEAYHETGNARRGALRVWVERVG